MYGFQSVFFPSWEETMQENFVRAVSECVLATIFVLMTFMFGVWYIAGITLVLLVYARSIYTLKKNLSLLMDKEDQCGGEKFFYNPFFVNFLSLVFFPFLIPYLMLLSLPNASFVEIFSNISIESYSPVLPFYEVYPAYKAFLKQQMIEGVVDQNLLIMHINSVVLFYGGVLLGCCSLFAKKIRETIFSWASFFSRKSSFKEKSVYLIVVFSLFYPALAIVPLFFPVKDILHMLIFTCSYLIGSCSFYMLIFLIASANKTQES